MVLVVQQEYPEEYCPVDGFQLVTYSTGGSGKDGRTHALCPECYNHAPLPNMEDHCCCNKCPHTACPHSMVNRGVRRCTQCDGGIICLEPPSQHGRWRASCNTCSRTIAFSKAVKSLSHERTRASSTYHECSLTCVCLCVLAVVKLSKHRCEKCGMKKLLVTITATSTAASGATTTKLSNTAKAVAAAAASIDPKVAYCLKCDQQLRLCTTYSFVTHLTRPHHQQQQQCKQHRCTHRHAQMYGTTSFKKGRGGGFRGGSARGRGGRRF